MDLIRKQKEIPGNSESIKRHERSHGKKGNEVKMDSIRITVDGSKIQVYDEKEVFIAGNILSKKTREICLDNVKMYIYFIP